MYFSTIIENIIKFAILFIITVGMNKLNKDPIGCYLLNENLIMITITWKLIIAIVEIVIVTKILIKLMIRILIVKIMIIIVI